MINEAVMAVGVREDGEWFGLRIMECVTLKACFMEAVRSLA